MSALAPGAIVAGRYRVVDLLGQGGMGAVYRAEQVGLGREVALKVVQAERGEGERARARFEREMRLTARLASPHTVRVLDFGEAEGAAFFTMELIAGESLERRLAKVTRLTSEQARALAQQVLEALDEAHGAGLVHRDLKPDNLMLSPTAAGHDFVRVLDFGVARPVGEDESPLTQTGAILGTPLYMAPEQARGLSLDGRADLYALGCVLFRALVGTPPFAGSDLVATLVRHVQEAPRPVAEAARAVGAEVEPDLAALVDRLLAKAPEDRPQSASEALAALSSPAPTATSTLVVPRATPRRRSRLALVVGALAVGGALVVWLATRPSEAPTSPPPVATPTPAAVPPPATPTPTAPSPAAIDPHEALYNDLIRLTAKPDWPAAKARLEGVTLPTTGTYAEPLRLLSNMVRDNTR